MQKHAYALQNEETMTREIIDALQFRIGRKDGESSKFCWSEKSTRMQDASGRPISFLTTSQSANISKIWLDVCFVGCIIYIFPNLILSH